MKKIKRPQEIDLYENFVDGSSSEDSYTSLVSHQEIPISQLESLDFDDESNVFNIGDVDHVEFQDVDGELDEDLADEDGLFEEDDVAPNRYTQKKSRYQSYDEDDEDDDDDEDDEDDDEYGEPEDDEDEDDYEDDEDDGYSDFSKYDSYDDFSRLGVDVSDMDDDHDTPYVSPYQKNKKRR